MSLQESTPTMDRDRLKQTLIDTISRATQQTPPSPQDYQTALTEFLRQAYRNSGFELAEDEREKLFREILDELTGFGPIQPLLDDPDITEIMVNRADSVYVERNGRIQKTDVVFDNDEHVMRIINRIVLPLGRRVDAHTPTVDARLPDGSRVNAAIPPVLIDGPCITIRKFKKDKLTFQQLIDVGSLNEKMVDLLRACVMGKLNVMVSGGTGSGKTTLLNVLSGFIPDTERIITIEDSAELQLQQDHVLRMETKNPDPDGKYAVTTRDLVVNSLRMRPDRIIVGECRSGEALDMLQAMNTGHDGSLTTIHANNPRDALSRLETICLMAGVDLPLHVIRRQIASAIDLIIQTTRLKDGSRKVVSIAEISGMEGEIVTMTELFKFNQTGVDPNGRVIGELQATGTRPFFSSRLKAAGFDLPPDIFMNKGGGGW